jgi:tetratricopeptide (TPR) repeat protein
MTAILQPAMMALWTEGDLVRSRAGFDAAYREAELTGDEETLALAALGAAGLWVHEQRDTAGATRLAERLSRAIAVTEPGSVLAVRLRCRVAAETCYRAGESAGILAGLDQARQTGDPVAIAEAASLAHHCLLGPSYAEQRHVLASEVVGASFDTGRRSDLLIGLLWRTTDLFLTADPHAGRRLAELRQLLSEKDHPATGFVVDAITTMLSIRAGDFTGAERMAMACAARGERAGDADATGWLGAHMISIRWFQGRITELLPMLREVANSPTLSEADNSYLAALAVALAAEGNHRQASSILARLHRADLPQSSSWLLTMYGVVEAACLLGDAELSASAYQLLAPFAHLPMMASLAVACFGSAHHALGVAALTSGDPARAREHLRLAIPDNLAIGHFPAAALSRARLAQALNALGDRDAARQEQNQAMSEAGRLGMILPAVAKPGNRAPQVVRGDRRGQDWELRLGHRQAIVRNSRGMTYLATLLANPGFEIPAIELAAGQSDLPSAMPGQAVLDEESKRVYRRRLTDLDEQIEEAESDNDAARAELARTERQWLLDELASAAGLSGRDRHFQGDTERARIAVGKAIRRALGLIAKADPVIGGELMASVRTGQRCSYQPR